MQIISLTVLTRRGVVTNQVQLIDVDDIASPLTAVGADSAFTLREGKKGPFHDGPTNTDIEAYVVDETLAQIAVLAGTIFTANVLTYKGRTKVGSPLMGFNAKMINGRVIPWLTGSKFFYQEDSDPALVEYTVSQTPAQILAQITNNSILDAWLINGNSEGVERYIGTNDNFDLPVYVNGIEVFRFVAATQQIQYPLGAGLGRVLTSDASGNASWQVPGGGPGTNELDPVIDVLNNPPGAPVLGDRYLVGTAPVGLWAANPNEIAEWDGAAWIFTIPAVNDYVYVTTTLDTLQWDGVAWNSLPGVAILQNGNSLGAAGVRIGTNDLANMWLKTNNALRVRIDSTDGHVRFVSSIKVGNMTTAPRARVHVVGAGATSATYSIYVQNSASNPLFNVKDDGFIGVGTITTPAKITMVSSGNTNATSAFRIYDSGGVQVLYDLQDAGQFFIYVPDSIGSSVAWRVRSFAGAELGYLRSDSALILDNTNPALHLNVSGTLTYRIVAVAGGIHHQVPSYISFRSVTTNDEYGGMSSNLWYFIKPAAGLFTPSAKVHIQGDTADNTTYAFKTENSAATLMFAIRNDGSVGINTIDWTNGIGGLTSKLAVRGSNGDFGYHTLGFFENSLNPTVNNGNYNRGLTSSVVKLGAFNTGQIVASYNGADDQGSGNMSDMMAASNYVLSRGSGAITNVIANYSDKQVQSGTITLLASFVADTTQLSGGTVTNMIGFYVKTPSNVSGGTRTNTYGLLIEANTAGTNNYGIVVSGNQSNGLGTLTPSAAALLELVSTDKAFLIMRMTAAQASAITPADGMGLYVTDTDATFLTVGFWKYENGVWMTW